MATIVSLVTYDQQPPVNRAGNNLTYSEVWVLKVTERITPVAADLILYALGLNNVYSFPALATTPHPDNRALLSSGFRSDRDDKTGQQAGYIFKVTVNFSTSASTSSQSQDPTRADPLYRDENVQVDIELDLDPITNQVITNSTGKEPIFPKLTGKKILKRFIISRNERNHNDLRALEYVNKLNKDNFPINGKTYDPRQCLLESWDATPQFDTEGNQYFVVVYKILLDFDGHKTILIDVGTGPDLNGDLPPTGIVGGVGTRPAKLDGNGAYMGKADQEDPAMFETTDHYVNGEIALSFLGFGSRPRGGVNLGLIARRL